MTAISIGAACTTCGICEKICPMEVLRKQDGAINVVNYDECISCAHCVATCPTGAIKHSSVPMSSVEKLKQPLADSKEVRDLITTRRSCRSYKKEKICSEDMEILIEAAHSAPTAHNEQGFGYTVIEEPDQIREIHEALVKYYRQTHALLINPVIQFLLRLIMPHELKGILPIIPHFERIGNLREGDRDLLFYDAPAIIIIDLPKGDSFADFHAGVASQNMMLQGHAMGIGLFVNGFLLSAAKRNRKIRKMLPAGSDRKIGAVLVGGYKKHQLNYRIKRKQPSVNRMTAPSQ